MDKPENNPAEGASEARQDEPEMVKEREMKEDGRYIIFYDFGDGEEGADDEASGARDEDEGY